MQQRLGHSDMESTMRYLKPPRSQQTREKSSQLAQCLVGSFAATREVNNAVIALQGRVLGAQESIEKSTQTLNTQKDQMEEAERKLVTVTKHLEEVKIQLKGVQRVGKPGKPAGVPAELISLCS